MSKHAAKQAHQQMQTLSTIFDQKFRRGVHVRNFDEAPLFTREVLRSSVWTYETRGDEAATIPFPLGNLRSYLRKAWAEVIWNEDHPQPAIYRVRVTLESTGVSHLVCEKLFTTTSDTVILDESNEHVPIDYLFENMPHNKACDLLFTFEDWVTGVGWQPTSGEVQKFVTVQMATD